MVIRIAIPRCEVPNVLVATGLGEAKDKVVSSRPLIPMLVWVISSK